MIIIGIDPGVETGFAVWHVENKSLCEVSCVKIHEAFKLIKDTWNNDMDYRLRLVIFEDARKRAWFGKSGKEVWQGAGSIKRDCKIWEDFLTDSGIPFVAVSPSRGKTKLSPEQFKIYTGYDGRTNEHSRDAGMLVYGYTEAMVQSQLRAFSAERPMSVHPMLVQELVRKSKRSRPKV